MDSEPTGGTFTFVFTDIEGSTKMLRALGDDYAGVLRDHDAIIKAAAAASGGESFGSEGDAQHLVFNDAAAAIRATVEAQRALARHEWPAGHRVRVRMGVHSGEAKREGDDFVGMSLHETARIESAGHGGQVLLSPATRELARDALPEGVAYRDLGEHQLKDVEGPLRIYQLDIDGLEVEFGPLRTLGGVRAVLPSQLSSFVGRAEVEAVKALVDSARLVTLTGPGGTGKTRLSIQVASEIAERFEDGTYFVELDAISDPDLVMSEVATVLRIAPGTDAPIERVIGRLRDTSTLLILDNLEQVIEAAADVAKLLKECPNISIIATSRLPLRIRGEQEFPVPALSFPTDGAAADPETAARFEAVRLFIERATAVRPDFSLDDSTTPAVVDIVTRLDGLPLAIELAAARLRMLTIADLRDRLDSSLNVLTGGSRDVPERQRTLRGAIEWSHDLLDAADRALFARFSVMAGGAAFAQAEAICASPDLGRDVFEGLESLHDQSLLQVSSGVDGESRFLMLVTIREYATEQLESSEGAPDVRERHAREFLDLAEEAMPNLQGLQGARWNDRLEAEHDNLRAALEWIVANDRGELGLRMIVALWRFWQMRGHLSEATERVNAVLALASSEQQDVELKARARLAAGSIAYWQNDLAATFDHYQRALELARSIDHPALLAEALYNAGFAAAVTDDWQARYAAGTPLFQESLELYRELGDKAGVAASLWGLSSATMAQGDTDKAVELSLESVDMSREIGDLFQVGWGTHNLGTGAMAVGWLDEAAEFFAESLAIWEASGDRSGIAMLVLDIGLLADARGSAERCWHLLGAAARMRRDTGTAIMLEAIEALGFDPRLDPETDQERAWFAEGERLSTEAAIALANAVLARPASA